MKAKVGDITLAKGVEAIVNVANGRGPMSRGISAVIGHAGGEVLRESVRIICEERGGFKEGECYVSPSGDLADNGIVTVYHAVTSEYPGGQTSLDIIGKSMRATLDLAIENGVKSIAFPGLGIDEANLNPQQIASIMVSIGEAYSDRIKIVIVDQDKEFIGFVKQSIKTEA